MLAMIPALNDLAEGWQHVMWAVVWQSVVLVGLATVIARLLRRSSPSVRYWLWQIVAIKLLLMPFWTFAIPLPSWIGGQPDERAVAFQPGLKTGEDMPRTMRAERADAGDSPSKAESPPAPPFWAPLSDMTWQAWLLLAWIALVFGQAVRLLGQRLRLSGLLKRGISADDDTVALVAQLARQIGLRRVPEVVSIAGDCPLFVCGMWRSRLVLPGRLMASLGEAERRQVLLHELAHLKRHDLAWGWPIEIARIVYFFHPLVYWVAYQLRLERELGCDQIAMAQSGHTPADYAQTLVQVVSHASQPAPSQQVAAISVGLSGNESTSQQPRHNDS